MAAARELFIYYRARTEDATAVQSGVMAFQALLRNRFAGLQARLLRRPEAADGWHTWMEIYALPGHPDGVDEALEHSIEELAADVLVQLECSPRHMETFAPCAC